MTTSKDPIQLDDTIQIRKTHGANRAETYTVDELNEVVSREEDTRLKSLELRATEISDSVPQMMLLAKADGTKNPDMELKSALPGIKGNKTSVILEFYEETATRTNIEFEVLTNNLVVFIPATMSEGETPELETTKTLGDLITAWTEAAAKFATIALKAAGDAGATLEEETVELDGGIDAFIALAGKQIIVIDKTEGLSAIYLCIADTDTDSDILADHWTMIYPPEEEGGGDAGEE